MSLSFHHCMTASFIETQWNWQPLNSWHSSHLTQTTEETLPSSSYISSEKYWIKFHVLHSQLKAVQSVVRLFAVSGWIEFDCYIVSVAVGHRCLAVWGICHECLNLDPVIGWNEFTVITINSKWFSFLLSLQLIYWRQRNYLRLDGYKNLENSSYFFTWKKKGEKAFRFTSRIDWSES